MKLRISETLSLPLDAVTQKFAILGTSGSGKSYTAMKMAELMLDVDAQIIAVDPVGVWYSLRLGADGKTAGYKKVVVFGGDHGDLPLMPETGALIGRLLAERRIPAVLDVSQFITSEMKRFLTAFAEQFFQSKKSHKSPVHLFLEECQTYLPQNAEDRDDAMLLNRWERLIKFFRNYGGGTSMISQQPQSVNKKVLNLADTMFALRIIGSHERKAILAWVKDVIESETDLVSHLPKLDTGVAHIWSPSWLKISQDIKILPRTTFDASKTPEMGVDAAEPKPLTPIDVAALKSEMATVVEKIKENDPKELKARIRQLEQEVKTIGGKMPAAPATVTQLVADPRAVKGAVEDARKPLLKVISHYRKALDQIGEVMNIRNAQSFAECARPCPSPEWLAVNEWQIDEKYLGGEQLTLDGAPIRVDPRMPRGQINTHDSRGRRPLITNLRDANKGYVVPISGDITFSGGAQKLLAAMLAYYPLGITRAQAKILCGFAERTLTNYISELHTAGAIAKDGRTLRVPDERATDLRSTVNTDAFKPPSDTDEVLTLWKPRLNGGAVKLLDVLVQARGKALNRDHVGEVCGFAERTLTNYVSELSSAGLLSKPGQGLLAANKEALFL
jgi:hypothetical protein